MEIDGVLYFRNQAIKWKYPDLKEGRGKDFWVGNMITIKGHSDYGKETIIWKTDKYPQPTEEEMLQWYDQFKHQELRIYERFGEQLDKLWHDIDAGLFGEDAKSGEFYTRNKEVKEAHKKPGE